MAEDPGFAINWFWLLAQALSFVLFFAVILVIGLLPRRLVAGARRVAELDERVSRLEKSPGGRGEARPKTVLSRAVRLFHPVEVTAEQTDKLGPKRHELGFPFHRVAQTAK